VYACLLCSRHSSLTTLHYSLTRYIKMYKHFASFLSVSCQVNINVLSISPYLISIHVIKQIAILTLSFWTVLLKVKLHMWRHLRKPALWREKYRWSWLDAARNARRLIRAFDICRLWESTANHKNDHTRVKTADLGGHYLFLHKARFRRWRHLLTVRSRVWVCV